MLALPFATYMTLGIIVNLSEPPFPIPQNEDNNSTALQGSSKDYVK